MPYDLAGAPELHKRDINVLYKIQSFFGGVGKINIAKTRDSVVYSVSSIKDLIKIIDHFDKYPLLTQKRADFELLKKVVHLMNRGEHLTSEGLSKIVSIRASINKGLKMGALTEAFPNITPTDRPKIETPKIFDPNWIAGFTEGEGCFYVKISKSKSHKMGYQIELKYALAQDCRDWELMNKLASSKTLGCGIVYKSLESSVVHLTVTKNIDLFDKVIPLFKNHELHGIKKFDFEDFCKVAEIVKAKGHLTLEGLEQIRKIKAGMNKARE
jgi:hypothetical protein